MDETRVERFREYRNSFIKEGSIASENNEETTTIDVHSTTSTLPMEEVINAVKDEKQKEAQQSQSKRKHVTIILVKLLVSVLLLAGLAVLGYFAWR